MAANVTEIYIDELQNYMSGNYLSKVIKMKSILVKSKNAFQTAYKQLISHCQQDPPKFRFNTTLKVPGYDGKDSDVRLLTVFKEIEFIHSIQQTFFRCKYHKVINQLSKLPFPCPLFDL
ncbi:uncharacterized protein LOC130640714 [Hydractinia symbiolongicarpus]|uniref:uncharacterized protein LOC130640714 n=1 Tax=Hydractinia symbiolongicarpus TaxID=13093 RepID=UPI0025517584|nr:uncharacterized protein LOC130640714 [Hydractinia symbiolongicarpus]